MKRITHHFLHIMKVGVCVFAFFLLLSDVSYAAIDVEYQRGIVPSEGELGQRVEEGRLTLNDIPLVIIKLIDLIMKLAASAAVISIIVAGFMFMFSGFSDNKTKAKNTLKYAVIGLVVAGLSWVAINLIQTYFTS